jgi:hypothetical protein
LQAMSSVWFHRSLRRSFQKG